MSRRQAGVLDELEEWREDVRERGIGSRVVLLAVPAGLGRSTVLARFRDAIESADGPVTVVAGVDGNMPAPVPERRIHSGMTPPDPRDELRLGRRNLLPRGLNV